MALMVVDAGGTHIRFAHAAAADAPLRDVATMLCADYPNLIDAIGAYFNRLDVSVQGKIDSFSIAIAGINKGDEWVVINNDWKFGKTELRNALDTMTGKKPRLLLINDFTAEALAQAAPDTPANKILRNGKALRDDAPLLIIGPGTGLGISALMPLGDGNGIPIRSEGGHGIFAPCNDTERALDAFMRAKTGSPAIKREAVLSGRGLEAIYEFLLSRDGNQSPQKKSAADIIHIIAARGNADAFPAAAEAIHIMLGILGGVMRDSILALGAWRGAVITGGIIPRMAGHIEKSALLARCGAEAQGDSIGEMIAGLPIYLATDPMTGLYGAKAATINPHVKGEWEW